MALHIRASTASDANTYSYQKLVLAGLTYPASNYSHLTIYNDTTGTSFDARTHGGGTSGDYYTPAFTFSVAANTTNQYRATARYLSSSGTTTVYSSLTSPSPPPPPDPAPYAVNVSVSGLGGNSFYVNLTGGAYSSTMNIEVRTGSYSGPIAWSAYGQALSSQFTVTGLGEYTDYYVKAYGWNSSGGNGTPGYASAKTLDKTLPYISATYNGNGKMFIDFGGYDITPSGGNASGLASYRVWISPRNSSSLTAGYDIVGLVNSYYTFETDANGLNFVAGSYYTLGVKSLDNAGNWSELASSAVTYVKTRPNNWNWLTAKVSGNAVNVTAVEWESLGKAINQFRTYKSLVVRDFTVPVAGNDITAIIFNQYCNGIRDMAPPTSPPTNKVVGDLVYASHFTLLTTSLNSIT